MNRASAAVLAAVLLLVTPACSGKDERSAPSPTPAPSSSSATPTLANGKGDEQVEPGTYLAPAGFEPEVLVDVPAGWTSVHRYPDAFDLGQPDPDRDAPLVAVVVMRPPEADAAAALDAVRRRAGGTVTQASATLAGQPAEAIDVLGGRGPLVRSADDGIALDAAPGQRARIIAADVSGSPLLVVVLVPDGSRWRKLLPLAESLVAGITPAT